MRKIQRQIAAATKRKEEALAAHVLQTYGATTNLAELHPDVRYMFALAFALRQAVQQNDAELVHKATGSICDLVGKYGNEAEYVTTTGDIDAEEVSCSINEIIE